MRRVTLRAAAALLWTGALCGLAPTPVAAHAELLFTIPAAGASLPEAPSQLTMTFSEAIDPITASVSLEDETGDLVPSVGPPTVDAPATTATVSLPALPAGLYTVRYRATSAEDGHITEGSWLFLVDPTGTRTPPGASTESSSLSSTPLIVITRWIALAFTLVLLGTAVFWLASARPALGAGEAETPAANLTAPWLLIAASAALAFSGLAAYLTLAAQPLGQGSHPGHGGGIVPLDFAAPFGATPFAMAMRVALIGSGVAFLLAVARYFSIDEARRRGRTPRDRERVMLVLVALAAALSLAGSSLASHAASAGGPLFGVFDWLHLVAVSVWLGTLPGLMVLVRSARRGSGDRSIILAALRRHSRIAIVAAPLVAATGLANSPLLLGSGPNLVATDYGDLLLAKALLFSTAIAIGSANYFLVQAGSARRVLPLILGEGAVGALAIVVAATLVTTQPAASRPQVLSRPAIGAQQLFSDAGDATIHVSVNLASPGVQRYEASVADLTTGIPRTDVEKITLVFLPPRDAGVGVQRVALARSDQDWLWGATGDYTPVPGAWTLGVEVEGRDGMLATTFPLDIVPAPAPELLPPPASGVGVPPPVAVVWALLPPGALGWLVPLLLLAAIAALAAWERQRTGVTTARWRVGLVLLVLATGVAMGARTVVEAANAPPAAAAAARNPIPATADSLARGQRLYLANCSSCHGVDGRGNGPSAAGLFPSPGDLRSEVLKLNPGELYFRITNGMVTTAMPPFAGSLTENDRWDLVNYLRDTERFGG